MAILPAPLQDLISALERLPGIGPKTASRLAFFLLRGSDDLAQQLAEALQQLKSSTGQCNICHNITLSSQQECEICARDRRDASLICVVEEPLDVLAMERTDGFMGRYHVLHGVLSPIEGVGPEDLDIRFENDHLLVHAKVPPRHDGRELIYAEYGVGDYYREFRISEAVDAAKISAEMKNGVLTLHLPKSESVKPRRIEVTAE